MNIAVYSSGIASAAVIRNALHIAFFVEQPSVDGHIERVINLRLIFPVDRVADAIDTVQCALALREPHCPN